MVEGTFNDAYCVMFSMLAVWQFQKSRIVVGIVLISLAISCKMSAALYLPAVYLIASKTHGIFRGTLLIMVVF
jgi:Gpi18-like mannosyltransferase